MITRKDAWAPGTSKKWVVKLTSEWAIKTQDHGTYIGFLDHEDHAKQV